MTIKEAQKIAREFDENRNPSEDDIFVFTEAMNFLIDKKHDPADMMYLGGYYYEIKRFDLALKYYEMAATYDYDPAYECLGYIWYYGRTGERDYKKACEYFSKMMDKGNLVATYKVADMYKNGYYVDKDYGKYKEIIRELYPQIVDAQYLDDPLPEIFTRLAAIEAEEGNTDEAIDLYLRAKDFLAQRIMHNPFFGNLNIMKWLIEDLYKLIEPDPLEIDFFDLYYWLTRPCKIRFRCKGKYHEVSCVEENGENVIDFEGQWYRTVDDFFKKSTIEGKLLTDTLTAMDDFTLRKEG